MHFTTIVSLVLLGASTIVSGHGGGFTYIIDGKTHLGVDFRIRNNETGSIQRMWTWDAAYPDSKTLSCRDNGKPWDISYHAPMKAGSVVTVNYTYPGSTWTFGHPYGPILAYMARCPDEGCEGVDLLSSMWFKIWETGLLGGTYLSENWFMKAVMEGANVEIPTPASLKPGKYLLKHDMVNLETGPVQIFPNCIQLDVSGSGNSLPDEKELVAFPGGYDKDWGLSWPNRTSGSEWFHHYHAKDTVYPMPGPPLWKA